MVSSIGHEITEFAHEQMHASNVGPSVRTVGSLSCWPAWCVDADVNLHMCRYLTVRLNKNQLLTVVRLWGSLMHWRKKGGELHKLLA